jgi:alpha-methylacyl-CoA racemase
MLNLSECTAVIEIRPRANESGMAGPLSGYRIIELAGIGPGPFAAMMLADMGAEVVRVERAKAVNGPAPGTPHYDVLLRSRRNIAIDLKHPDGVATLLELVASADGLIEGFRPGVMERLGIGPQVCLERNPRLVFGRMTGWGQSGPFAEAAGHDINYISLAGALAHFGRAGEAPVPPLNMVGDFGGGGMFLAFGVVCALLDAQRSGLGQVVDAAMVDGAAVLMSMFWSFRSIGVFDETHRGTNLLDTGAHFYDVYQCADGTYISIGSIEPQFYAELLRLAGLDADPEFVKQMDKSAWPHLKQRLSDLFATKTCDEWCSLMEATDVCFAPVLTMSEAAEHPHNIARGTFVEIGGTMQPAPAPRFSRTTAAVTMPPAHPGQHTTEILRDWGFDAARIDTLIASRAVAAG